jgi:hypothetical protein
MINISMKNISMINISMIKNLNNYTHYYLYKLKYEITLYIALILNVTYL